MSSWGRADADGTVWVRTDDGERVVGQYPGASPEEALAYFQRKFDDLEAQVSLLQQRLRAAQVSPADAQATIGRLEPTIRDANAVGDLAGLLARLHGLTPLVDQARAAAATAREEIRAAALARRAALVEEAEALAAPEPQRITWKSAGDRLRELFDQWRELQRDTRLDKPTEDDLWKRFSHARTTFDRKRRQHFGALDDQRNQAREQKERLVEEAEALATSTAWGATSAAYRELMTRWKQAGRAQKQDDDALWGRFRAAQDGFFAARDASQSRQDAESSANLTVKEGLLAEAERLLPVRDVAAARTALRDLQARWEAAGAVPRAQQARLEAGFRKVEQSVQEFEQEKWRRSNPAARARAEDLVRQVEATIAGVERDAERARAKGDERGLREAEQSLATRREWLAQARTSMEDFTG